ncbi:MAG: hypothetical protein E7607_01410 [Ruminococcaceae bacterium]|nr:hypothetical protein [Oscillospiraceae bacterium]
MKNSLFEMNFDADKGRLTSLYIVGDNEKANFIKDGRGLCEIHTTPWYDRGDNRYFKSPENWTLESFEQDSTKAIAVFSRRGVVATQTFTLYDNELRIHTRFTNTNAYPVYFKREDIALYTPFADSYDDSLTCQRVRVHTHMAPFGENSYVRVERMGISEYNLGVIFLRGNSYSYSQEECNNSDDRGYLIMNIEPFTLTADQSYDVEVAVFAHKGRADFFKKARTYSEYIDTYSENGYVFLKGESGDFTLTSYSDVKNAKVRCNGKNIPFQIDRKKVIVSLQWQSCGEKRIDYEINGRKGCAYFYVSLPLEELQKRRAKFIVKNQQCLDKNSPLYGAYLIYDNEEKRQYFSFEFTDHNANRERMVMALFLAKYIRKTQDKTIEKSLYLFNEFLLRECVDEETGAAFNNIGRDAKKKRLYNAPWVFLYFCELYLYDGNERWINLAYKMIKSYYANGGATFYPNGIRFSEIRRAFEKYGDTEMYSELLGYFDEHISELQRKGTEYPPHEVNYEQTIVSPAACLMIDKYLMCKDEKYVKEAEKHLELLIKFNGCQPDYRLNKIPIRYWDNYWFGKMSTSVYGDTMPQPSLAHSAHCFYSYGIIKNDKKWIDYGKQAFRGGFCLFNSKGEAASSYVYPARVNGFKGQFFDPYANEQDGFLYLAYKTTEEL